MMLDDAENLAQPLHPQVALGPLGPLASTGNCYSHNWAPGASHNPRILTYPTSQATTQATAHAETRHIAQ